MHCNQFLQKEGSSLYVVHVMWLSLGVQHNKCARVSTCVNWERVGCRLNTNLPNIAEVQLTQNKLNLEEKCTKPSKESRPEHLLPLLVSHMCKSSGSVSPPRIGPFVRKVCQNCFLSWPPAGDAVLHVTEQLGLKQAAGGNNVQETQHTHRYIYSSHTCAHTLLTFFFFSGKIEK